MATPWHQAISEALWLPSRAVIVLALAVVGMRLGSIASRNAPRLDVSLTTPLICKLLLYPALMLMVSLALPCQPWHARRWCFRQPLQQRFRCCSWRNPSN